MFPTINEREQSAIGQKTGGNKMIIIRNVEELEAERERQLKAWIETGKKEDEFYLMLEGADLSGGNLKKVDLEGAVINNANLRGANLMKAN
jgi:hypothetical protein